jgi:hypothetical protein
VKRLSEVSGLQARENNLETVAVGVRRVEGKFVARSACRDFLKGSKLWKV